MLKVHLYDSNGYKSCSRKNIPIEFKRNRKFSIPNKYTKDVSKVTCKICQYHVGKPYFLNV
jgi:hypothetical protein